MWYRGLLALGCLACLQCGDDMVDDADVVARLDVAVIAGTWHAASSGRVVDSVVCSRECYTRTSHWETLTITATDSIVSRERCSGSFSQYVSRHSAACDTVVVAQTTGNTECSVDTGRWYAHGDTLCMALAGVTECYTATVDGGVTVLSLTGPTGATTNYSQRTAP